MIDRKSTSGYAAFVLGNPVTWATRKQTIVASSSFDAEYIAASEATKEAIWLKALIEDFDIKNDDSVPIYEDNQSVIKTVDSPQINKRSKHIVIKYMFLRDNVQKNVISFQYVNSANQTADILTKALPSPSFLKHREALHVLRS